MHTYISKLTASDDNQHIFDIASDNFVSLPHNASINVYEAAKTHDHDGEFAGRKVTAAYIADTIKKANTSFLLSKDAAAEAVAHAYQVWNDTMSPRAHIDCKHWLDAAIARRNEEIDQHNKEEKELKKSAPDTYTKQEWAGRREVLIKDRKGGSQFIKLVKFVFDLVRPSDSSIISRYATVLDWVHATFNGQPVTDIAMIVEAINDTGGFEVVLKQQRGTPRASVQDTNDQDAIAKAIVAKSKTFLAQAEAKAKFPMAIEHAKDGIVMFVGRYVGGIVEVVADMPFDNDQHDRVMTEFIDKNLLHSSNDVEFIANVLNLGSLISEGQSSNVVIAGLTSGKKEPVQRVLTAMPNHTSGLELMVSARFVEASVIIKAIPNPDCINLGHVSMPLMLEWEDTVALAKAVKSRAERCLLNITANWDDDSACLNLTNAALTSINSPKAECEYSFVSLEDLSHRPCDVDGFKPQFAVDVTLADLQSLYDGFLADWKTTKAGSKNKKHVTLVLNANQMAWQLDGKDDHVIPVSNATKARMTMKFRPRDLHDLVDKLIALRAVGVQIKGDSGGLLCVSFSDAVGDYKIYLPTATSDHQLEHRRVAEVRLESEFDEAA